MRGTLILVVVYAFCLLAGADKIAPHRTVNLDLPPKQRYDQPINARRRSNLVPSFPIHPSSSSSFFCEGGAQSLLNIRSQWRTRWTGSTINPSCSGQSLARCVSLVMLSILFHHLYVQDQVSNHSTPPTHAHAWHTFPRERVRICTFVHSRNISRVAYAINPPPLLPSKYNVYLYNFFFFSRFPPHPSSSTTFLSSKQGWRVAVVGHLVG